MLSKFPFIILLSCTPVCRKNGKKKEQQEAKTKNLVSTKSQTNRQRKGAKKRGRQKKSKEFSKSPDQEPTKECFLRQWEINKRINKGSHKIGAPVRTTGKEQIRK